MPKKLHDLLTGYVHWPWTASCGCSFAFFVLFIVVVFFLIVVVSLFFIVVVGVFKGDLDPTQIAKTFSGIWRKSEHVQDGIAEELLPTMETQVTFPIFIVLAATLRRLVIHVVIIILGISPEWVVRVVHNRSGISTFTRRTRGYLRRTHSSKTPQQIQNATVWADGDMMAVVSSYRLVSLSPRLPLTPRNRS